MNRRIRVLVVDDMALVRAVLTEGLAADAEIEVGGTAGDPYAAARLIPQLRPDVITLDVEMPRMDGVEFLRRLMPQHPLPVVMVSALTESGAQITLDALEAGAVDFVTKPAADIARGLDAMMDELRTKVKIAATANLTGLRRRLGAAAPAAPPRKGAARESTARVIAIGASTGGTEALRTVITRLPPDAPGVVVVQHMPPGFTRSFAERLNKLAAMEVREAQDGDRILRGRVLVAPGALQMRVRRSGAQYGVEVRPGDLVCGHCPSVEVLMHSVAASVGPHAIGVMLTGMGHDGADAMRAMREAGARTLAQDEASCVVFGMPKEAFRRGGAERLVPLEAIAAEVLKLAQA